MGRSVARWLAVLLGVGVAVWICDTVYDRCEVLWARRVLVPGLRTAEVGRGGVRNFRRVPYAAVVLSCDPCPEHDRVLSDAISACRFDASRCCHYESLEMPILQYLSTRTAGGSTVAREACLDYLTRSTQFTASVAGEDRSLCASVVDQQNLLLGALRAAGDSGGLAAARRLATSGVPIGIVEAVAYVGRFGCELDEGVLDRADARIARIAPAEVRPVAEAAIAGARAAIAARSHPRGRPPHRLRPDGHAPIPTENTRRGCIEPGRSVPPCLP